MTTIVGGGQTGMTGDSGTVFLKQIDILFRAGTSGGATDSELIGRFLLRRDAVAEAAFSALVERHGAMVLRVCREVLGDQHDAEDAAQAVFFVLARQAGSISRRDSVASWLHGVALRVAVKSRRTAARRRARERRLRERMTNRQDGARALNTTTQDLDRWDVLHEELDRLPAHFRAPLLLLHFEGLTQEQAASQLRLPLGTLQSRSARGRARLKTRLEKRNAALPAAFLNTGRRDSSPAAPPAEWVEATVRLALQFTKPRASSIAAGAIATELARQYLRTALLAKGKATVVLGVLMAAVVAVAAARSRKHESAAAEFGAKTVKVLPQHEQKSAAAAKPRTRPNPILRTVRGIVRDEQGRPVAKAWVGDAIEELPDYLRRTLPKDRATENGGWYMENSRFSENELPLTDSDGRFEFVAYFQVSPEKEIHFASHDFSQRALQIVRRNEPNKPLEIVLRRVRKVRARVVETPEDHPDGELEVTLFATNVRGVDPSFVESIAGKGALLGSPRMLLPKDRRSSDGKRWLEADLVPGRYRLRFQTDRSERLFDFDVSAGDGVLELPEVRLETLACIRMVGKPAAEIEAVDLDGKSVRLADYRGKVVVLDFWANSDELWLLGAPRMLALQKRFNDQPIEFLAIHDASVTSLTAYREVIASVRKQIGVDALPFRMLLDRPPNGNGTGPYPAAAGKPYSGRTSDRFEIVNWPSSVVIDKSGRVILALVGMSGLRKVIWSVAKDGTLSPPVEDWVFSKGEFHRRRPGMDALESALEELFGLPPAAHNANRSGTASKGTKKSPPPNERPETPRPHVLKGSVVDLDGRPIEGATVSSADERQAKNAVKTGPNGDFALRVEDKTDSALSVVGLKAEAPGMATRIFLADFWRDALFPEERQEDLIIDETGVLSNPLSLGPGVTVTGRVVKDGKPKSAMVVGLDFVDLGVDFLAGTPDASTDANGVFRFAHVLAGTERSIFAEWDSKNGGDTITPRRFRTGDDGTTVDLGQIEVTRGKTLAGRVVFSDGKKPYREAVLVAQPLHAGSGVLVGLDDQGRFRIDGLPNATVSVLVRFDGETADGKDPPGYRLSARNKCLDPRFPWKITGRLDRDVTDLTVLFEPGEADHPGYYFAVDPKAVLDFADARAGTITGAPPPQSVQAK
jgi:RNA polymerase sigma factor (sigma-70 family)